MITFVNMKREPEVLELTGEEDQYTHDVPPTYDNFPAFDGLTLSIWHTPEGNTLVYVLGERAQNSDPWKYEGHQNPVNIVSWYAAARDDEETW